MNAAYYLVKALETAPKDERDVYGRSAFSVVCRDLLHSIEHWVTSAHQVLDVNNWNLEQLAAYGRIRKPQIRLYAYVTIKDNLVVEWSPDLIRQESSGFSRFSDSRYGYQDPDNRLVMIHEFETLRRSNWEWNGRTSKQVPYEKHVAYLFKALEYHIHSIRRALDFFVEVNLTSDLELRYAEGDRHPTPDGKLLAVDIRDLEEKRRKEESQAKAQWLKTTFDEQLGCAPDAFLRRYRELKTYAAVARAYTRESKRLSPSQAKAIVERLMTNYPEIARKVPDPKKVRPFRRTE